MSLKNNYKLEIACFNVESAGIAQASGAHRVELCARRELGGITPTEAEVRAARALLHIDLYVMIRPRGGNFVYDPAEIEQMRTAIQSFKTLGVDGFVFGLLQPDNSLAVAQNQELIHLAQPLPCTLHRAFDRIDDARQGLEAAIACGFTNILTSGGASDALAGRTRLQLLHSWSDNRISIMPGGGIRSSNIEAIVQATGTNYYHSSAITASQGDYADPLEVKKLLSPSK